MAHTYFVSFVTDTDRRSETAHASRVDNGIFTFENKIGSGTLIEAEEYIAEKTRADRHDVRILFFTEVDQ